MNYSEILSRAWKITWNYKILWVFGFLANLAPDGGFRNGSNRSGQGNLTPEMQRQIQQQLQRPEVIAAVVAVIAVILLIAIVFFALSIIGRGGLIGGVRLADDQGRVTFGESWAIGQHYFWRMFGIELLLFIAGVFVAGFGLVAVIFSGATLGLGLCIALPVLCVLALALIPLSIVAHFARFSVVLEDLPVVEAFRRSWDVLKNNLGPIIVLGLILLVIGVIAGLVLVAPLVAIVLSGFIAFIAQSRNPNWALLMGPGLALLCYLPIAIALGSILETWTTSVWTIAYRQLIGKAPTVTPPVLSPAQPG